MRRRSLKFRDCIDCRHLKTWRCVRCTAGEEFEEKNEEIDLDELHLLKEFENDE